MAKFVMQGQWGVAQPGQLSTAGPWPGHPSAETWPWAGPHKASASHQKGLNPGPSAVLPLLRAHEALVGPDESSKAMMAVLLLTFPFPLESVLILSKEGHLCLLYTFF